ncbi:hypothetical protein LOK49_LG06G00612, partial [Camellia lanceoleosa]
IASMPSNNTRFHLDAQRWSTFMLESICSTYVTQITDPILQMYMEAVNLPALSDNSELLSDISGGRCVSYHVLHLLFLSAESYEIHDAELSTPVLRLINVTDSGLHSQVLHGN